MANLVDLNKEIENLLGIIRKQRTNQNWIMIENALNSLSAQIQLLVAPPSGNSNTEVTAARVGLDGTTYASLKANLDNIQKMINNLENKVYSKADADVKFTKLTKDVKDLQDDLETITSDVSEQLSKNLKDTEKAIKDGLDKKQDDLGGMSLGPWKQFTFAPGFGPYNGLNNGTYYPRYRIVKIMGEDFLQVHGIVQSSKDTLKPNIQYEAMYFDPAIVKIDFDSVTLTASSYDNSESTRIIFQKSGRVAVASATSWLTSRFDGMLGINLKL